MNPRVCSVIDLETVIGASARAVTMRGVATRQEGDGWANAAVGAGTSARGLGGVQVLQFVKVAYDSNPPA